MCTVMQNPLPPHDVACVTFVIAAGVQVAVVFRNAADATTTRRRCPAGITREVNQRVREADELNSRGQRPRNDRENDIDPVRVEQVNSTGIVRHIRFRNHPGIELTLLETFAFDDVLSGWRDIVSSQGPSDAQSKSLHNHLANESF